jgi:mono/diheme cytochrome c family protein
VNPTVGRCRYTRSHSIIGEVDPEFFSERQPPYPPTFDVGPAKPDWITRRYHASLAVTRFRFITFFSSIVALLSIFSYSSAENASAVSFPLQFVKQTCADCHSGKAPDGGFDAESLNTSLDDPKSLSTWIRIIDRVKAGEMPPKDAEPLANKDRKAFVNATHQWMQTYEEAKIRQVGRVQGRRLTNLQLERTLQDLTGIDIPLAIEMPAEPKTAEFNTFSENQTMSHFHLEQHLKIVDLALDEMFRRVLSMDDDKWDRHLTAEEISRKQNRCREPEYIDNQAVIWSSRLEFYGRLPVTEAKEAGWYRLKFQVQALKKPEDHGVWSSVRMGEGVSSAPLLSWGGSFEADQEPKVVTMDIWLPYSHLIEIRPHDRTLKQARFQGGQAADGEGGSQDLPGIGIDWLSLERIHKGPTQAEIRNQVFPTINFKVVPGKDSQGRAIEKVALTSEKPNESIRNCITKFAKLSFRQKVSAAEIQPYIDFSLESFEETKDLAAALRAGFRSILCSPRFLYFHETPGQLDDYAIASRLSYFLWNSMPDEKLFELASQGKLSDDQVLDDQVDRMLRDPKGKKFVPDFAAQWLELAQIDFTEPDAKLYPDFDLVVQNSMLDETHRFLQYHLEKNSKVTHFVDSDVAFMNSRLARYYKVPPVESDKPTLVKLDPESHRSGLLTQGSILKVTANGTNTSPVLRGLWVARRILGDTIPPPPENVPAIEPDIRGAKTIRDQLEKHREDSACAFCHAMIDPPGFALENFDAAGRWRNNYLKLENGRLQPGAKIDPSYKTVSGKEFKDVRQFQKIVASRPDQLARNFAEKLIAYGTGAPITYADRVDLDRIVKEAAEAKYGMRSIIKLVVKSSTFQNK